MNRTPTTSETNSAKSTTQAVFNYAEAAKRSSQIQDQRSSSTTANNNNTAVSSSTSSSSSSASPSNNNSNNNNDDKKGNSSAKTNGGGSTASVNGGSNNTASAVNPQQPSFASTLANSTSASNSYPFFLNLPRLTFYISNKCGCVGGCFGRKRDTAGK
ncbi:hypothetical protein BDB00DRAFT_571726 [Zychaea mexicana]|uniref:uncharacterized protein n=1 Tax=Zychaea mexicana TaxID=64656 RepID=UPI0022FE5E78|nr:uncharacterized protein BDB00DRAFT_571726 [Zychaea mexicana]KAI9490024.1 hypothetical protein BDB00DRAFT_571726 [Zychaea mexicana]